MAQRTDGRDRLGGLVLYTTGYVLMAAFAANNGEELSGWGGHGLSLLR